MGKFDKYSGNQNVLLPGGNGSTNLAVSTPNAQDIIEDARAVAVSQDADRYIYGDVAYVAIALDATGSMANLLSAAKGAIVEIISRTSLEAGRKVEVEIVVYRDYDVADGLTERSGCESDPKLLAKWLGKISARGGGANGGEAVEAALKLIADDQKYVAVLLAGDEPSNSKTDVKASSGHGLTAYDLAQQFGARSVPIHSFVVGNRSSAISDFALLSKTSGGKSGRLDGSAEMIDLAVMAILATIKGSQSVKRYMESHPLSPNSRDFGQLLLGGSK